MTYTRERFRCNEVTLLIFLQAEQEYSLLATLYILIELRQRRCVIIDRGVWSHAHPQKELKYLDVFSLILSWNSSTKSDHLDVFLFSSAQLSINKIHIHVGLFLWHTSLILRQIIINIIHGWPLSMAIFQLLTFKIRPYCRNTCFRVTEISGRGASDKPVGFEWTGTFHQDISW